MSLVVISVLIFAFIPSLVVHMYAVIPDNTVEILLALFGIIWLQVIRDGIPVLV